MKDLQKIINELPPEKKEQLKAKALYYALKAEEELTLRQMKLIGKENLIHKITLRVLEEEGLI